MSHGDASKKIRIIVWGQWTLSDKYKYKFEDFDEADAAAAEADG
jgi:hypothetical protein